MSASSDSLIIRAMRKTDLSQIIKIDTKILGKQRPHYWEHKLESVGRRPKTSSLVAVIGGEIVGFIIGGASRYEFGIPEHIGWIDTIGVNPEFQRRGIARILFKEMAENLKKDGVDSIFTLVTRRDWRLLKFFNSLGFEKGDLVNLELDI